MIVGNVPVKARETLFSAAVTSLGITRKGLHVP